MREIPATGLSGASPLELLQRFAAVVDELKRRKIVRTLNNPIADYTEWLVASRMDLRLLGSSKSGFDAEGADGTKYQIKGRRVVGAPTIIQLSALRGLASRPFDILIAVVFDANFAIRYALSIPHEVVVENSKYQAHTNAHRFCIRRTVLEDSRVQDIGRRLAPLDAA